MIAVNKGSSKLIILEKVTIEIKLHTYYLRDNSIISRPKNDTFGKHLGAQVEANRKINIQFLPNDI